MARAPSSTVAAQRFNRVGVTKAGNPRKASVNPELLPANLHGSRAASFALFKDRSFAIHLQQKVG